MPSIIVRVAEDFLTDGYLDAKEVSKSAKTKLTQLLDRPDLEVIYPLPLPRESRHVSLWVSALQEKRLLTLGRTQDLSAGLAAGALLLRDFERSQQCQTPESAVSTHLGCPEPQGVLERALHAKGWQVRGEQQSIQRELGRLLSPDGEPGADMPRVLFCEAGTGTGKTMAYLGSALDYLQDRPQGKVYVAAPSFALLAQVRKELELLLASAKVSISYAFLAGQSEFVSEQALQAMADGFDERVDDSTKTTLSKLLLHWRKTGVCASGVMPQECAWAMPALIHAMPDFAWTSDVTLADRQDDDDRGWLAYERQFTTAYDAQLVVMTHAMLASLVKRRMNVQSRAAHNNESVEQAVADWKKLPATEREEQLHSLLNQAVADLGNDGGCDRLPNADLLIVDEAHTIEDAFANAFGSYLSLRSLEKTIRNLCEKYPAVFSKDAQQPLTDLIQGFKRENASEVIDLNSSEYHKSILNDFLAALRSAVTPSKRAGKGATATAMSTREAKVIRSALRTTEVVVNAMEKTSGVGAFLHWSPHKEYPRLSMGRLRLDRELDYVWTQLTKRTALVSGTLYEEYPKPSCETLRRALAVPFKYVMTMSPIHSEWQFTPVTLCMISHVHNPNGQARFVRPASKTDKSLRYQEWQAWMDDVSGYALRVIHSAKGGTMILGTAFADIEEIAKRLRVAAGDTQAFIVLEQRKGVTLQGLREEFLEASRKGPVVLCAVGAAWTGFDLYDPQNPDSLTDLVMLNAPFGVSTVTMSRIRRQQLKTGHFEVAAQALVLVRQALGRLVRSPDTPSNRRVHWLDARIYDPSMAGMMLPIKRFLAKYRQLQVA